jgi:hypothetical protein
MRQLIRPPHLAKPTENKGDNLVHPSGTLTQADQGGKVGMHQMQQRIISTTLRAIGQRQDNLWKQEPVPKAFGAVRVLIENTFIRTNSC